MGNVSDKIRLHIGEGELDQAIETLTGFLKTVGGDLYNQAINLKGSFRDYQKNKNMGIGDNTSEKSRISMAVLNLASQIEKQDIEHPPTAADFARQQPSSQQIHKQQQQYQPQTYQQKAPQYIAQCIFNGDMMQYYLNNQNQIFAVNPMTNQPMHVGMKMPASDFRFAWTLYFSSTNIYYLVDNANIIWGQNFGMPVQVGYVRNMGK